MRDDAREADSGVATAKSALRAQRAAARRARGDDSREQARAAIREVVLHRAAAAGWSCVAAYVPLRTEPGSVELLAALHARGITVLVPVVLLDRDLDWAAWEPSGIGPGLGRDAVARAQAVLVPAYAVDGHGLRLGRGGGSYDRALPRCAPTAETAAVLFDGEQEASVPSDPWDVPVRAVVTPSGWTPLA